MNFYLLKNRYGFYAGDAIRRLFLFPNIKSFDNRVPDAHWSATSPFMAVVESSQENIGVAGQKPQIIIEFSGAE